jgi:hypothetical protein
LLAHQPGNLARTRSVITAPIAIAITITPVAIVITVVAATPTTFAPIVIPIIIAVVIAIIVTVVVLIIIGIIGVTADNGGPAASLGR